MSQASLHGVLTRSADMPEIVSKAGRARRAGMGLWPRLMSHRGGRLGLIIVLA